MQCNIDRRGRIIRQIYGAALMAVAIVLLLTWARSSESVVPWIVTIAILLGGAFAFIEGLIGWCVIRAMGFRTPM